MSFTSFSCLLGRVGRKERCLVYGKGRFVFFRRSLRKGGGIVCVKIVLFWGRGESKGYCWYMFLVVFCFCMC